MIIIKTIPQVSNSARNLYKTFRLATAKKILTVAIKYKIFDHLEKPVSGWEVSDILNFDRRNTELFLNVLAGMEIINKKNGLFYNSDMAGELLVSTKPVYMGDFLLHLNEWSHNLEENLEEQLIHGAGKKGLGNIRDEELWAKSARLSANHQICGASQYIREIAGLQPEFAGMRKMLDLGGGAGLYSIALVSSHPTIHGVVFEQPAVASVTREFISRYEAEDRISVMEGNYITDSIGEGYDLVFASATLNFAKNQMEGLFRKIYDALNPGGLFITHQDGITDERTKPVEHVMEMLSAELQGLDFAITRGLIADCMKKTGFIEPKRLTILSDFGEMDIDIGKKPE